MTCAICTDPADEEHPDTVYGLNPVTFRQAVLHWYCFTIAYEDLEGSTPKQSAKFSDRQDEYNQLVQNYPTR